MSPTRSTDAPLQQPRAEPRGADMSHLSGGEIEQYLVRRRNAGVTPDEITRELVAAGWAADLASRAALRSLRRTDRHALSYWSLVLGAGSSALATASALHLAMTPAADRSELALASWITVALVAAPVALAGQYFARRSESCEPHVIWSPTRRSLFGALAAATAVVGLGRLLTYVFEAVAALVGVEGYELDAASFLQVLVSLGVSVPLFVWALFEWRRSNVAIRSLSDRPGAAGSSPTVRPGPAS